MIIVQHPHEIEQTAIATIGMFDGVHSGHRSLLQHIKHTAASRGIASAVITFAKHPRLVLNPQSDIQLLTTYDERMQLLADIGIDYAIVFDFTPELAQHSAQQFITLLHNDYHIEGLYIGYDHRFGHNRSEGFAEYQAYGKQVGMDIIEAKPFDTTAGTPSSSVIRKALTAGNIKQANTLLGYDYSLTGTVVEGHQLGRELGFPTANIVPNNPLKLLPGIGVYAVRATLPDGSIHNGMMNIGRRPTINGNEGITLETHLFDFTGNLYGKSIKITFVDFMRNEERYTSLHALQQALTNDARRALEILQ